MQYTRMGNTGLIVSRLSFGTMTFGTGNLEAVYKVNEQDASTMVHRALDAGVNFFDTADAYASGQSEEILGRALGDKRKDVVISTKAGFRAGDALIHAGLSRRHLIEACEASLDRLDTDYIDLFHVHRTDPYTPLEETIEALEFLVQSGMVRYIGYSNWPAWMSAKAFQMQRERGWAHFASAQMYYSLVGRDIEHEIVPFMRDAGVGMMVWSPLAGGFLSGKYTRESRKEDDNRLSGFDFLPLDKEWGYSAMDKVNEIAQAHGATPAQVSLAWLLSKPYVSSVIIGASKIAQLDNNLGAIDLTLTADELNTLDEMTKPRPIYPNWFNETTMDEPLKQALGK
jgi:aryl-alcohol dehydrogenase-like predicted oxidoreductase